MGSGGRCPRWVPAIHASDKNAALQIIDQSMDDGWRRVKRELRRRRHRKSTKPNTDNTDAIVAQFSQGKTVDTGDQLAVRYERIRDADQRLGRVTYDWDAGQTDANFKARVVGVLDNTPDGSPAKTSNWDTAAAATPPSTRPTSLSAATSWTSRPTTPAPAPAPGTTSSGRRSRTSSSGPCCRKDGTDQACSNDYVEADWVIRHLLGGGWPQFDAANASIDTSGVQQIDQMAYPDGISAREVLDDLMLLEPALYWTTGPDVTGLGYQFAWGWPTTVRYEATLEDGGDFPTEPRISITGSWSGGIDKQGRSRSTIRTGSCPILDAESLTRQAVIDPTNSGRSRTLSGSGTTSSPPTRTPRTTGR